MNLALGRRSMPRFAGRRVVRAFQPAGNRAMTVLVVGGALTVATSVAIHELTLSRFGAFELADAGVVSLAVPALVAITLAGWTAAALPPPRRQALGSAVLLAGSVFAAATLPSLPGLAHAVTFHDVLLGACLAFDALFVAGLVLAGIVDAWEGHA